MLRDINGDNYLQLPADGGFNPNSKNENPFATDGSGHFSFVPSADEIGAKSSEANYFLRISAQGYITRMIQASLQPTQAMDHETFDTGQWLAYCGACPLPEMANAFLRCGIPFRSVTVQ